MYIVADKEGNQLLELIQGNENVIISNESYRPLTGSLVVVKSQKGFMLLKNKRRQTWEIAGGVIEHGETPRECAVRECFEESGYVISDLRFIGLIKCFLVAGAFYIHRMTKRITRFYERCDPSLRSLPCYTGILRKAYNAQKSIF